MAITLEQVQAQLQAAWAAINVGELSYEHQGHQVTFHSLDALQRHIDWLRLLERELVAETSSTGAGSAAVVRFVGGCDE